MVLFLSWFGLIRLLIFLHFPWFLAPLLSPLAYSLLELQYLFSLLLFPNISSRASKQGRRIQNANKTREGQIQNKSLQATLMTSSSIFPPKLRLVSAFLFALGGNSAFRFHLHRFPRTALDFGADCKLIIEFDTG